MLTANTNTGVLEERPKGSDYLADVVSGISYEVVNPSGDWSDSLPQGEIQIGKYGDTFACVTFSALNCLEVLTGKKDSGYSDRYTAKQSGTTRQGNYLTKVADSIRHDGLVEESEWSWEPRGDNPRYTWDEFYKDIPQDVQDKGKEFAKKFDIQYEWVPTDVVSLKKHLKQAPLQIVTQVCGGWNKPPVNGCGFGTQHATMLYKIDDEGYHIFDHYEPFKKVLKSDYVIAYAMKYVISMKKPMLDKYKGKLVRNTATGAFGLCLGSEILTVDGSDRAALLALDTHVRLGNGFNITPEEWDSIPHRPF